MTEFIIIRHGQTEDNIAGKWQGQTDSPLSATGVEQAQALGRRLQRYPFAAIYSSDLGRAHDTASYIARQNGHDIILDKRLRERHVGIFQGLTIAEIKERYPDVLHEFHTQGRDHVIPNGESANQHLSRILACLEEIVERYADEMVVIVTHGGTLRNLLIHTLDIPFSQRRPFRLSNTAINIFTLKDGEWMLDTWGDVSHLREA